MPERRATNDPQNVGARIAHLRTEAGLTRADLAELVRVSRSYLGLIENGHRTPSAALLTALADALDTTTTNLLGEDS